MKKRSRTLNGSSKKGSFVLIFSFFFFICNLVLILFAELLFYRNTVKIITDSSYSYTYTIMDQANRHFDTYMSYHYNLLDSIATDDSLVSAAQCYERGNVDMTIKYESRLITTIKNACSTRSDIWDVLIIMENGLIINKDAKSSIRRDYDFTATDWYQNALQYDRFAPVNIFYFLPDYYEVYTAGYGEPVIAISQPVYNYLQQKIGAVFYMLNIDDFWKNVMNESSPQYGDLLLINSENKIITHSKHGREGDYFSGIEQATRIDETTRPENLASIKSSLLLMPSDIFACNVLCTLNVDIRRETADLLRYLFLILLLSLMVNAVLTIYIYRRLNTPLKSLVTDMLDIPTGKLQSLNKNYKYAELIFIARNFNLLLDDIKKLNNKQMETQLALQKAQNEMLISKINPHFLFNSLQLIQTENLYGSKEKTNSILLSLSNQLRYNIYNNHDHVVPLSRELKQTLEYLQLCSDIYDNNLKVEVDIPEELLDCCIPKLTLQSLVENSLKHGFEYAPTDGLILISARRQEHHLILSVRDNGKGISTEQIKKINQGLENGTHKGIGFMSLEKQMNSIYGQDHKIVIRSDSDSTTITLEMPYQKNLQEEQEL